MKKFIVGLVAIVIFVCGAAMTACAPKSSSAVTIDELIREDFAAEKEAEDDAKGREHIEIPEGAEVIEKDGEEWIVINSTDEFTEKLWRGGKDALSKNYILSNDLIIGDNYPTKINGNKTFKGKFDGNNYKIYATQENGGLRRGLFSVISEALIENVIFSAADGSCNSDSFIDGEGCLLFEVGFNSTIRNCVNYWQPNSFIESKFMGGTKETLIENCINYADLYIGSIGGGIALSCWDGKMIDCANYGNISGNYNYDNNCVGGIVGRFSDNSIIENSVNYGKIVGLSNVGGIVGKGIALKNEYANLPENQIIKNCKNYGDIYLTREKDEKRVEEIEWDSIYRIGGIAGSVTKVENCVNEGNFYGFESFGKGINVEFCGGVVGVAKEVKDCTTKHTISVQKGRDKLVGDIYGILIK